LERQLPKLAKELEESAEEKEEAPWTVNINEVNYDNFTIKLEDSVPASPVTLTADQINIHAENVSTKKDSRGSLSYSLTLNETGTISAESSFGINPVAADVTLDVKGVDITTLQPYITEKVNILITDGSFAAGGILSYAAYENEEMMISYKGDVSLSKFTTVDKTGANDFLKWNSLYFSGIDFNLDPLNVHISDVSLTDFYSRLIVNPDGSLNVQGIMKEEEVKEESPSSEAVQDAADIKKETGPDKSIKIDTVTLQAGTVNFSDNHIKPNYSANLKEVGGRVSGLSSEEGASADVSLRGKLENHAPLEITGVINPLGEDLYVDLDIDFSDMDLSPLTPYANKFVGYNIQKGQLSLDLKYLIVKKKLDSQNSVLLDQFTLGERVESPDATKLPVKFAISLLKDRKGEINLDIPVTGEIGDPEFSIGGIVIKMIVKLLVKAATSPFALLGALVGGGEELSYIDYEYGSSGLSENEKAKLDKLSKALDDRPALNIEIIGHVDTERDREVMRQAAFDEKLKAQKFKEMVKKGEEVASVNEVDITQEEYELYLTEAYKEEKFPKPKNALGSLKILPPSEMEKLIYTHIKITDDDLRLLASKRALNVKDYFLNSGGIAPNRVFLIEPESLQPKENEKLKSSRVDFKLK
jgi:acylphosphatase